MSDETDVCGHPTASGGPCQHPTTDDGDPDRCWEQSHNDAETTSGDAGRPSNLDDHRDEILQYAKDGMSIKSCAEIAGVGESTLYDWLDEYDKFSESFKRARAKGAHKLAIHGRLNEGGCDTSMAKFLLERSHGYTKTEKKELEHSGEVSGSLFTLPDEVTDNWEREHGDE